MASAEHERHHVPLRLAQPQLQRPLPYRAAPPPARLRSVPEARPYRAALPPARLRPAEEVRPYRAALPPARLRPVRGAQGAPALALPQRRAIGPRRG